MLFPKDKLCIFQSTTNTFHYRIRKLLITRVKYDHVITMESDGC